MPNIYVRENDGYVFCLVPPTDTAPPGRAIVAVNQSQYNEIATLLTQRNSGVFFNDGVISTTPAPVPETVSAGDFMRAMLELGWYDAADAAITALEAAVPAQGKLARVLWSRASKFERNHPMVIQIATAIGKNSADLDDLFNLAATY